MSAQLPLKRIEITSAGGTINFNTLDPYSVYELFTTGPVSLIDNFSITRSGPEDANTTFFVIYRGNIDLNGRTFTVAGTTIPQSLLTTRFIAMARQSASGYFLYILPNFGQDEFIDTSRLKDNAVTTNKIVDDAVTLSKLANITRGNILVGGPADAPTALNAKQDGYILIGDGTDLNSVPVTGPISISNAGVTSIKDNSIQASKLAFSINNNILTSEVTLNQADILDLYITPFNLVPAQGTNRIIEVLSVTGRMVYDAAAFATNVNLRVIIETATDPLFVSNFLINSTNTRTVNFAKFNTASTSNQQLRPNSPVNLTVETGNPTGGGANSVLKIYTTYRILEI